MTIFAGIKIHGYLNELVWILIHRVNNGWIYGTNVAMDHNIVQYCIFEVLW